ncbi:cytidine deaminase [Legionella anisa]|uniref:Cytidine deaminase n=1 Tax=Legionella anisa TaxID=28082 RepID=A0AAX0WTI1_9GAMM|nr:cytidine deaminase [Legionella anisa]AWN74425.1 cytidine deaminase [Legionella anisa]KTC71891.1 cytidine deaminase [Legionella anisa]MBN5935423.1 cytidine deaminase [Legionella anisa]MCW8425475.1 cytidine deaminase [Legionella anisa]MCW8449094.1 cytidine deaminase [Legionella anisa]
MDQTIAKMISNAHKALAHSYSPYSKFSVACCICTDKDNLYTGINVENSSYGLAVCAETSAISAMVSAGEQRIKSMVVLAGTNLLCSPCGACRQRIYEFSTPDTLIHLCDKNSILHSFKIDELLPLAFKFDFNP